MVEDALLPSPVLDEVKIMGGISSQYSLTSLQNASTFSSGLARFPALILRFLSTLVNTIVTGMSFSPRNSRQSRSSLCGLMVESMSSITAREVFPLQQILAREQRPPPPRLLRGVREPVPGKIREVPRPIARDHLEVVDGLRLSGSSTSLPPPCGSSAC